ncbi:MAG: protein kinase [Xenococcaceae cyanobacterium]
MKIICTRPDCPHPHNSFADLDDPSNLKTAQQKYCTSCSMPLILAGRYIPSRLLGKGGFGAAFLARDRYTPAMRQCVVKQFQPSGNLSPKQLEIAEGLFEREAAVLEQLGNRHKQIPDLYAFFPLIFPSLHGDKEEQFFYLVQEFIDGQDLEEELAAKGKFSEAEVLEVLEEILNILKFVHENHSIHRDIKPSNIMRNREGRLYLLDFGAVKQVTAGAGTSPQGRSTGIYSMGFAPPEQMAGSQIYPSTDLYALAATCLNLLTGKKTEDLYDSYNNRWNWKPQAPQVSDRLGEILDRMLLPTPSHRFQSAEEILNALNSRSTPQPNPVNLPPQPPSIPQPPPTPQATPSPVKSPPQPPPTRRRRQPSFSLLEILGGAAFTGFEGALLFIAFTSLLPNPAISMGLWGMSLGGLIFAQYRRIIEKVDLLIIAGISSGLVWFVPALHKLLVANNLEVFFVIVLAIFAGAAAIAVTALFRLIYQLLSRFL